MTELLGVPVPALMGQLTIGLINGAFYALMSLGLTVIFGMLRVINFTHGAQFTLGAFGAWALLSYLHIPYWAALLLVPLPIGLISMLFERTLLRRLYDMDHLFQLLLTFGLAQIIEGLLAVAYGSSGQPYDNPLPGGIDLGFMFLPYYRAWVVIASLLLCFGTWFAIERTRLGAYLRAATDNRELVRTFGINVPRLMTLTYGIGVALAALAGVLAAPMDQVRPLMGSDLVITVFAVVVIGGMGSILGSVVIGFALGVLESFAKVYYPPLSSVVIFIIMVSVILVKPTGLLGRQT
ncbi:branched-chain amino acid ABC transporter permease [Paraburkholderia domus]|uniref:High-affinity branched-chain amino acid transport system permease protein LivH n=1 Tax=Paraburkholderia domus TaxID=2793075 RepID=A0A9N8R6N5_9BURK|nr:branched-chain amino acid ABC transporter permease [Paraburkholderia domus]MBK5054559.1 branched-chain amino acid ABC transporter permease [Burkholderia sp. R-70006]MBK5066381.1 branched-chain amino acid ABC transporter permease [Burkholderia sp. R-70199]MBK5170019.1 branched-chain amino acid ABC transporter permease [Burkholderia sp. R-70211]MBK5186193.1 branched-chain amino acid ABC transporter permease [Burkholderia sp. R-69749]CAE6862610.1 High-affinity branched-chain amino acid transpo